jgi:GDP-4-dehydro-6-deoxy-D-mannose reductase
VTSPTVSFSLHGARVLVTGASGFVGGHLRRSLQARGATVSGIGKEPGSPSAELESWFVADLEDAAAVLDSMRRARPDAVVHLAGQASAGQSFREPEQTFRVNVIGTWNLLDAIRSAVPGARTLVIGSGEAYGPQPEGSRAPEATPFRPVSPYAFSKAAADEIAGEFAEGLELDIVRTRSFSHTGPGQTARFALPSWAQQVAAIERSGVPGVLRVGNLEVTRDLLDVRDVVEAYTRLLEVGVRAEVYNVCRGEGVRLGDVARALTSMARVPVHVEVDPARVRAADVPYLVGDPGKIEKATGWRAARPLERMLEDVLEGWRGAEEV